MSVPVHSVLSPASQSLLRGSRDQAPFFSNMIAAEMFEAENTRGPFKILPHAGGGYVVFDTRAPNGQGVIGEVHKKLTDAKQALARVAAEAKEET